jgi:hypothetical protein
MEAKKPADAPKTTVPSVPLENLHAPEFFASWIKSVAFEGPNVHLTFVSQRWDHTIDAMREVVVGRVVMPINGVANMAQFLAQRLQHAALAATPVHPDQPVQ